MQTHSVQEYTGYQRGAERLKSGKGIQGKQRTLEFSKDTTGPKIQIARRNKLESQGVDWKTPGV